MSRENLDDYLVHWGKGKQAKKHKYISRELGKNGKWIYTYASNLASKVASNAEKKAQDVVEIFTDAKQDTSDYASTNSGQEKNGFLNVLNIFQNIGNGNGNKQGSFAEFKNRVTSAIRKPISSFKSNKSFDSIISNFSKSKKNVSSSLKQPVSSIKNKIGLKSKASIESNSSKSPKQKAKREKLLSRIQKGAGLALNGLKSRKAKAKIGANPDDPRPANDKSMDHSKSNKTELFTYLAGLGVHYATSNPIGLQRDAVRAVRFAEAPIRKLIVERKRKKSEIDSETGLHIKSSAMSKKEDMAMVNPEYKNFDGNTKNNCMLCTTAYDLRRRGYEVSAKKASVGYDTVDCTRWYKGGHVELVSIAKGYDSRSIRRYERETIDYIEKQGEGARGNLMITWSTGGGHSVAYEVENGKVVLYDCQTNTRYTNPHKLLKDSIASQCMRTDNLEVDYEYIKEAVR